jgi:hypothetical protein
MRHRVSIAAGLLAAPLLAFVAHASDPTVDRAKPPNPLVNPVDKDCPDGQCGKHGTTVAFEDSPAEAGKKAKKEEKLVMVLHVSGLFEDPKLT